MNPQLTLPHVLQLNGDLLVQTRSGVAQVLKRGKPLSPREPGFGKKFSRGFGFVTESLRCVITGDAPRCVARGDLFAAPGDFLDDSLFVDHQREGFAHARVVERLPCHVKANEIRAEVRKAVEVRPLEQNVEQFDRDQVFIPNDIGGAGLVKVQGGVGAGAGQQVHNFTAGVRGVPVTPVLAQPDAVIDPPGNQFVGAAAGHRMRHQPAVAIFFDGLARHHAQRHVSAEVEEERRGIFQFDAQRVVIHRFHSHLRSVSDVAAAILLAVFQVKQHTGILACRSRIQHAQP